MIKQFILVLIVLISFNTVNALTLEHTDNFNTYVGYLNDSSVSYNVFPDNQFNKVLLWQTSSFSIGTYYHNYTFQVYEQIYKIKNEYIVTSNILPGIVNVKHSCIVYNNDIHVNTQVNEFKSFTFTSSCFRNSLFFGTYTEIEESENKIYMEHYITTTTKRERYNTYICDVPADNLHMISNLTIEKNLFSSLILNIEYATQGSFSEDYYINQLSSPLAFLYKYAFKFVDSDKSLLNVMLVTEYLLSIILYILAIITKSFFTIYILILIFIIPLLAYMNSSSQTGFINIIGIYYYRFFNFNMIFVTYIVRLGIKLIQCIPII